MWGSRLRADRFSCSRRGFGWFGVARTGKDNGAAHLNHEAIISTSAGSDTEQNECQEKTARLAAFFYYRPLIAGHKTFTRSEMSLGLCVRKDAEGLRKALLRAKARKQRTSYCPVLFQGSALFQESRGTARKQVEVLFSGTDVDGCGPHLLKGVSVCSTSRGVYALAEGFSCKTVRARGHGRDDMQ